VTRIRQRHGVAFLGIVAFVALGASSTSAAGSAPAESSQFTAAAVSASSTITAAKSSAGRLAQTLPVPSYRPQGGVPLMQVCNPSTIGRRQETICTVTATNDSFRPATVGATSRVTDGLSIIHADGATISRNGRTAVAGPVSLAGKLRATAAINPIDPLDTPGGGYVPLSQFGVVPTAVGDETIVNYDVPEFVFGGETYDRIGVVSNGYIVLGGGDAADISFTPQHLPDPARPNGLLAPYWTDLNGEDGLNGGGEGIRVASLLDDVSGDSWLLVDWDINLFGDPTTAGHRNMQVWIGVNGREDVTYSYDTNALTGAPAAGLTVGAENESGSAGAQITGPPTTSYILATTPAVPGQSLSYDLTIQGVLVGSQTLTTRMRSDVVAAATVATNISVTKRR
jgi:hypothetical protein